MTFINNTYIDDKIYQYLIDEIEIYVSRIDNITLYNEIEDIHYYILPKLVNTIKMNMFFLTEQIDIITKHLDPMQHLFVMTHIYKQLDYMKEYCLEYELYEVILNIEELKKHI